MHLFINRSQIMPKHQNEWVSDVITTLSSSWTTTEQMNGNMESIYFIQQRNNKKVFSPELKCNIFLENLEHHLLKENRLESVL